MVGWLLLGRRLGPLCTLMPFVRLLFRLLFASRLEGRFISVTRVLPSVVITLDAGLVFLLSAFASAPARFTWCPSRWAPLGSETGYLVVTMALFRFGSILTKTMLWMLLSSLSCLIRFWGLSMARCSFLIHPLLKFVLVAVWTVPLISLVSFPCLIV